MTNDLLDSVLRLNPRGCAAVTLFLYFFTIWILLSSSCLPFTLYETFVCSRRNGKEMERIEKKEKKNDFKFKIFT